jgi:hypothetical protein
MKNIYSNTVVPGYFYIFYFIFLYDYTWLISVLGVALTPFLAS